MKSNGFAPLHSPGHPHILHSQADAEVPRFLSEASCRTLVGQVHALGFTQGWVNLLSQWRGTVRWARNRISDASDWRDNRIWGSDNTSFLFNQVDSGSLREMGTLVQRDRQAFPEKIVKAKQLIAWAPPSQAYPRTQIWSDRTYDQTPDERETVTVQLIDGAERAGMLSAGYISVEARGSTVYTQDGLFLYAPQTLAQCSMTVRDPKGTGSGWAGASSYDWNRFDAHKLAEIALDKCLKSRNPVKIEPGRYTTILEPQATFDLISGVIRGGGIPQYLDRLGVETSTLDNNSNWSGSPFGTGRLVRYRSRDEDVKFDPTRIGERVMDERISLTFDPLDPDLGVVPFENDGDPYVPVAWVDHGVLTNLSYNRDYALRVLQQPTSKPNSGAFRMSGGTDTIDEMIAATKRGLLVTRFWDVFLLYRKSMLYTGLTRDGLWLIENGKISHPVQNLRFTESPLFALNQVEQLGVPVPIFSPDIPAVVPPVKVRDFSFTALIDAI